MALLGAALWLWNRRAAVHTSPPSLVSEPVVAAKDATTADADALRAVLASTTRVRVWASDVPDDVAVDARLLVDTDESSEIAEIVAAVAKLRTDGRPPRPTGPAIELLSATHARLAVLVLADGYTLYWRGFVNGPQMQILGLAQWLAAHGAPESMTAFKAHVLASKHESYWFEECPKCLWQFGDVGLQARCERGDIAPVMAALAAAFPRAEDQHRAVLTWHAMGNGSDENFPGYQLCAEVILRAFPRTELWATITSGRLGPAERSAARSFIAALQQAPQLDVATPWPKRIVRAPPGEVVYPPGLEEV